MARRFVVITMDEPLVPGVGFFPMPQLYVTWHDKLWCEQTQSKEAMIAKPISTDPYVRHS